MECVAVISHRGYSHCSAYRCSLHTLETARGPPASFVWASYLQATLSSCTKSILVRYNMALGGSTHSDFIQARLTFEGSFGFVPFVLHAMHFRLIIRTFPTPTSPPNSCPNTQLSSIHCPVPRSFLQPSFLLLTPAWKRKTSKHFATRLSWV